MIGPVGAEGGGGGAQRAREGLERAAVDDDVEGLVITPAALVLLSPVI